MSRKFKYSEFIEMSGAFLSLEEPRDLAKLLNLTEMELIRFVKRPYYRFYTIRKGIGKTRTVVEPEFNLKCLQERLNSFLQSVYYLHKPKAAHGFIKNPTDRKKKYNIMSNAQQHTNRNYVINADVFRFFPSITGVMVREVFLNEPFNFGNNLASALALLCINKNWLPTGAPTSPAVSNFVCRILDAEVKILADKYNYTYTRYADDLTFSGDKRPDDNFKKELSSLLEQFQFQLNRNKYRINSKHSRQIVTGIMVNEKLNVSREYRRKLRAIEYDIKVNGLEQATKTHLGREEISHFEMRRLNSSLKAKLDYVKNVQAYQNL